MRYTIKQNAKIPAYQQLYKQIRDDIINEIYPYNTKLPSKRLVADEVGVSIITVEHAYALLCEEGYVEAKERSGYFVAFRATDGFVGATDTTYNISSIAHSHTIYKSEFSYPLLSKTMRKVMNDYGERLLERPLNAGCLELRDAIRQYLARSRGILADTEQIIIGSGAEYLYRMIVSMLGQEHIYAIESPSYNKIEQVYLACHATLEMLPLGSDGIESHALQQTKADILHITPYRSFPSGVTASASKRHEYLRWAGRSNRYIVEDDFESEFSVSKKPEDTLFSHTQNDNVIYMNTFSKTISPALRVGYMVLPKHLVNVYEEKLGFYSCTVPTFEQFVLAELISGGDFERHINRVRRNKRKELAERS
ncbi:MAG: PLP-dependent aminotransferase family protein [Lachnospira sp.]|nr:PLP-dependent aminotransferase family protein [Lachnospira sp.]